MLLAVATAKSFYEDPLTLFVVGLILMLLFFWYFATEFERRKRNIGTILTIGAAEPFPVSPLFLLIGNRAVKGWYSGVSIDSQDTLAFAAMTGIRSMNEEFPLERVKEAYERMISGKVRFRAVLTM